LHLVGCLHRCTKLGNIAASEATGVSSLLLLLYLNILPINAAGLESTMFDCFILIFSLASDRTPQRARSPFLFLDR